MKNTKTFRLFVSSTFNDFKKEREVLQTQVFPVIEDYCIEKGYHFQPIDLRWGINDEAQLDQQTLDLCLKEVRACKSYPYPNFLVMLGDRYGWIPLPYCIEQNELETLLGSINEQEKSQLLDWYQLDKNQLPASYLLKPRSGEYAQANNWAIVENNLLNILQQAVSKSALSTEQQRKYFTSATEAEIIEGIVSYENETRYQKQLLQSDPTIKNKEKDYLFAFIRNIDINSKQSDVFINSNKEGDYNQAQVVKSRVEQLLKSHNKLIINTTQIDEQSLNETYLTNFAEQFIAFLKNKLDKQIAEQNAYSEPELEQQQQASFAQQKRQDFIGQQPTLDKILEHVSNKEPSAPFVLHGQSGSGKSSIMAKAIDTAKQTGHRVIYRFVGATPSSGSIIDIFQSIFAELEMHDAKFFHSKEESFEEISKRLKDQILSIKEPATIFIDAVDQLSHQDQLLWLPERLPEHIKLVISALNDKNYEADSRYFEQLNKLISNNNMYAIEPFNKPKELLLHLLKKENRTLQEPQLDYVLKQYQHCQTPLYIYMAVQELKHWKSFDLTEGQTSTNDQKIQALAASQQAITQEFIHNLSSLFHHDKALVQKVLAYLYASNQGLSENEILTLLNADPEFIQTVAPETFHKNSDKQLPLVLWARLYYQLKPFLSQKKQHNEGLLFFFHREFIDVVSRQPTITTESEQLIDNTFTQIHNRQQNFNVNRWGILYSEALTLYITNSDKCTPQKSIENSPFINHRWFKQLLPISKEYLEELIAYNLSKWDRHTNSNAKALELAYLITKPLSQHNRAQWLQSYTANLNNLAIYYDSITLSNEAIKLAEEAVKITEGAHQENPEQWEEDLALSLISLAHCYKWRKIFSDANLEKALEITEKGYQKNPSRWAQYYVSNLNNLGSSYLKKLRTQEALGVIKKALLITEELYQKDSQRWAKDYINSLLLHSECDASNSEIGGIAEYKKDANMRYRKTSHKKALACIEKQYQQNPERWTKECLRALACFPLYYEEKESIKFSILEKYRTLMEKQYENNRELLAKDYADYLRELGYSYKKAKLNKKAISFSEKSKAIIEKLYQKDVDNLQLLQNYTDRLSIASSYKKGDNVNHTKKVIKLAEKVLSLTTESVFLRDPETYHTLDEYYSKLDEYYNHSCKMLINYSNALCISNEDTIELKKRALSIFEKRPNIQKKIYETDRIHLCLRLANDYRYAKNLNEEAIKLEEASLPIIEKAYKKERLDIDEKLYTRTLNNLSISYESINRSEEAIKYAKKALIAKEEQYQEDPKKWKEGYSDYVIFRNELDRKKNPNQWKQDYAIVLNNLAISYNSLNNSEEAIKQATKALAIIENEYQENPSQWKQSYSLSIASLKGLYCSLKRNTEAIKLAEKYLRIRKQHQGSPEHFTQGHKISLFESYLKTNLSAKAVKMAENSLSITEGLYQQSHVQWGEYYIETLNYLAASYHNIQRLTDVVRLHKKALTITEALYKDNTEQWEEVYRNSLNNLAISYNNVNLSEEAISLYETVLSIVEKHYKQDQELWIKSYSRSLENLAYSYKKANRIKKALKLYKKTLSVEEEFYQKNGNARLKEYKNSINNLVVCYDSANRSEEAIKYAKKALKIQDKHYRGKARKYSIILSPLDIENDISEAQIEIIKQAEEEVTYTRELYERNPDIWIEEYLDTLSDLSECYCWKHRVDEAMKLNEARLEVIEKHYKFNPTYWIDDYIDILWDVAFSYETYRKRYPIKKAIKPLKTITDLSEKNYLKHNSKHWANKHISYIDQLASLYREAGNIKKARVLKEKADEIRQKHE